MGFTPTVYRWDDAGAPSIGTRKPSEIINILKKCLVDGYGSKLGAGWTIPFQDGAANSIVFRNSTEYGSGGFVKIWAKTSGDVSNDVLFTQNAPFISSLNPDWSTVAGASYRDYFMTGANIHTRWVVYATPKSFYILIFGSTAQTGGNVAGTTSTMPLLFVGDFQSLVPGDVHTFITISSPIQADVSLTGNGGGSLLYAYSSNNDCLKLYETASLVSPKRGVLLQTNLPLTTGYGTSAITATPPPSFNMTFMPVVIGLNSSQISEASNLSSYVDSQGVNHLRSMLQPVIRGILPGLHLSPFLGCAIEPNIYKWIADGIEWHLMPQYHYGGSRVWLSTGEWYA
jgi:hypothetical protein